MEQQHFFGKRVLVTGAASGIGRCIAEQFQTYGADVIGLDCDTPDAEVGFRLLQVDISNPQQVEQVSAQLQAEQPHLDILVNAAGILRLGNLETLTLDDWQSCLNVNVSGVFYLLKQWAPVFKRQKSGAIVSVASNAAHVPRLGMTAYCTSKAALVSLSHCVGLELAAYGVRCNLVSPGSTDTAMLRGMPRGTEAYQGLIDGSLEQFKLGIPLRKIAKPEEIANAVLFLASDLASHITLQDIVIDGGATLAA
ncbi:2,3-dihydro-2,3-dihydroxybenzoate dehydrogenase [Azomonas agilis]|uniref:2,3-dihydro-2,3-dihydroxybenzoate dehydrogenase n=1 Tax=Azomonas agilis TaxID=116849 RepID=A0A562IYI5_9GAMM|nr:2,3-dihydro-2,3-dihydroxybenzoate dehydrogenase [Azomonas agilis]TWH75952.1 2,3-dihydro-2,3-dihydroxybenzoate dehydrogenase [Azomonas agilis]